MYMLEAEVAKHLVGRVSNDVAECYRVAQELIAVVQQYDDPYVRREHRRLKNPPSWTVLYNVTTPGTDWVGTGWEFFDDESTARKRYDELNAIDGHCATLRPYYRWCDYRHLGGAHHA